MNHSPYRLFFATGLVGLIIGLSVWVVSGIFGNLYFGRLHAHYMIGVFLLNFIIGFLFTAIPRMSGGPQASKGEVLLQFLAVLNTGIWGLFQDDERFYFLSILLTLFLLFVFCFRRVRLSKQVIPEVFPMVLVSLASGMLGPVLFLMGEEVLGGRLFYLNLVLGLCVGIGARLIPMLLRLGFTSQYRPLEFWIIGLLLTVSCFVEVLVNEGLGNLLRSLIMVVVFFRYWKAHIFSGVHSSLGWGLRISATSIVLGTIGMWLFPDYRLESLHVLYISGFGLLTLMVASRVILAHGNHDLKLEFKNWFIKLPIGLILLSMGTRVSALFIDGGYERHLAYAAFTFLLACFFWGLYFIPKLVGAAAK